MAEDNKSNPEEERESKLIDPELLAKISASVELTSVFTSRDQIVDSVRISESTTVSGQKVITVTITLNKLDDIGKKSGQGEFHLDVRGQEKRVFTYKPVEQESKPAPPRKEKPSSRRIPTQSRRTSTRSRGIPTRSRRMSSRSHYSHGDKDESESHEPPRFSEDNQKSSKHPPDTGAS